MTLANMSAHGLHRVACHAHVVYVGTVLASRVLFRQYAYVHAVQVMGG